ncbi:MAG TPA: hypothetical protein VIY86_13840, partial [Pirellulaceae bacterium]
ARLIYEQLEFDYQRAKMKAARRVAGSWVKPVDLPRHGEIHEELQTMVRTLEGAVDIGRVRRMREEALRCMRILRPWQPRLVGSVVSWGHSVRIRHQPARVRRPFGSHSGSFATGRTRSYRHTPADPGSRAGP